MAKQDRVAWDLFDAAERGELQRAEERRFGVTINPHYLLKKSGITEDVATSMALLPLLHGFREEVTKKTFASEDFRAYIVDSQPQYDTRFAKSLFALERVGLVSIGSQEDQPRNLRVSVTRRGTNATYREVIAPSSLDALGCIGKLSIAGAIGVGSAVAGTAALELPTDEIVGNAFQLVSFAAFGFAGLVGTEHVSSFIEAAQVHRQYQQRAE